MKSFLMGIQKLGIVKWIQKPRNESSKSMHFYASNSSMLITFHLQLSQPENNKIQLRECFVSKSRNLSLTWKHYEVTYLGL